MQAIEWEMFNLDMNKRLFVLK